MTRKKRVIVLGGSGLVGSACVQLLKKRGYTVLTPAHAALDLTNSEAVEAYIARSKAHIVINTVGLINLDAQEKDPLEAWQVNAMGAGNLARAVAKHSAMSLVHLSTAYVFDGKKAFYAEDDNTGPLNVYGHSKMIGDSLIRHYCEQAHTKYHIVRASWLYGAKRPTFVDAVLKTLEKGEVFDASVDQRGNPTYVDDFVEGIVKNFVDKNTAKSGVFHIENKMQKGGVSRYDIAQEIARIMGMPKSLVKKSSSKDIFTTPRPSVSLINTKLPPLRDWREALRVYLATTTRR